MQGQGQAQSLLEICSTKLAHSDLHDNAWLQMIFNNLNLPRKKDYYNPSCGLLNFDKLPWRGRGKKVFFMT